MSMNALKLLFSCSIQASFLFTKISSNGLRIGEGIEIVMYSLFFCLYLGADISAIPLHFLLPNIPAGSCILTFCYQGNDYVLALDNIKNTI